MKDSKLPKPAKKNKRKTPLRKPLTKQDNDPTFLHLPLENADPAFTQNKEYLSETKSAHDENKNDIDEEWETAKPTAHYENARTSEGPNAFAVKNRVRFSSKMPSPYETDSELFSGSNIGHVGDQTQKKKSTSSLVFPKSYTNKFSGMPLLPSRPDLASTSKLDEIDANNLSSKSEKARFDVRTNLSIPNEDNDLDVEGLDKAVNDALSYSSISSSLSPGFSTFNTTSSSSWRYLETDTPSLNDSDSMPEDCSEIKYAHRLGDSIFSDEKELDSEGYLKSLAFKTSTPFKSQTTPPDLVPEVLILKSLEYTDGKIENISQMVDSMHSEVLKLEQIAKRKESNNKILSESFDEVKELVWKAEDLNNSICTKTEMSNSDLLDSLRTCRDDDDDDIELTQKYEDFDRKLSSEETTTKDLREELDLLRREFTVLECRVTDIEDQKQLNEKIREIQEKKDRLSRVRKNININGCAQGEDSFSQQETEHLFNKLEEKHKYFMKIANTWEQLESDLIHFQNDLKSEVEKLKTLELGKSAEYFEEFIQDPVALQQEMTRMLSEKCADAKQGCHLYHMAMPSCEGSDSGISDSEHDCERDRKLSDLRQLQKDLDSVLSSNKKILIAQKMDETEAELLKLKNLRRLVFHSTLLPQTETEQGIEAKNRGGNEADGASSVPAAPWNIHRIRENRVKLLDSAAASGGTAAPGEVDNPTDDPDKSKPPYKSNSHIWRIVRSALPFHLVIIVIACMVWMYEPSCCDHLNNLNLSRSPQLKFIAGPPPI